MRRPKIKFPRAKLPRAKVRVFSLILAGNLVIIPGNPIGSASGESTLFGLSLGTTSSQLPPPVRLADVMKKDLSGLDFEYRNDRELQRMDLETKQFAAYRSGDMGVVEKSAFIVGCLTSRHSSLFCQYLDPSWPKKSETAWAPYETPQPERVTRSVIATEVKKGNYQYFTPGLHKKDIRRGIRYAGKWENLVAISKAATDAEACPSLPLLTYLGMRAEEDFPDPEVREWALKLYSRAADCGPKNGELANLSRFRASLLHIWNDRCDLAAPYLSQLMLDNEERYLTRAMFWQAECAQRKGEKLNFALKNNQLLKKNPLGYHSLAINGGRPLKVVNLVYRDDEPQVMFRSHTRRDLNDVLRVVELMIRAKEFREAQSLLRYIENKMEGVESEYRLYLAIVSERAQAEIGKFRMLSKAFRAHPEMINRKTLEVFYPLKRFKTLWKHRSRVDPYLVAALIRQESGFVSSARSSAGALGLMQLLPSTARQFQRVSRWQLLRPATNVKIGVRYFQNMLKRFNGDAELALAAYNAGPRNVDRWVRRYPTDDRMLFLDLIPFSETRNYVSLIGRNYYWYLSLYAPDALVTGKGEQEVNRSPASLHRVRQKARFSAFSSF